MLFQSLTGSIHTSGLTGLNIRRETVSIPHRFNSHYCCSRNCDFEHFGFNPSQVQFTHIYYRLVIINYFSFQSLTGSIHTRDRDEETKYKQRFQSLTGSIHTLNDIEATSDLIKFQSLTGSIHTFLKSKKQKKKVFVSIPHRFNSHKTEVKL